MVDNHEILTSMFVSLLGSTTCKSQVIRASLWRVWEKIASWIEAENIIQFFNYPTLLRIDMWKIGQPAVLINNMMQTTYHRGPEKWFPCFGVQKPVTGVVSGAVFVAQMDRLRRVTDTDRWVFFPVFPPFPIPAVSRGVRHFFADGRGGRFGVEFRSVAWIKSITGDAVPCHKGA